MDSIVIGATRLMEEIKRKKSSTIEEIDLLLTELEDQYSILGVMIKDSKRLKQLQETLDLFEERVSEARNNVKKRQNILNFIGNFHASYTLPPKFLNRVRGVENVSRDKRIKTILKEIRLFRNKNRHLFNFYSFIYVNRNNSISQLYMDAIKDNSLKNQLLKFIIGRTPKKDPKRRELLGLQKRLDDYRFLLGKLDGDKRDFMDSLARFHSEFRRQRNKLDKLDSILYVIRDLIEEVIFDLKERINEKLTLLQKDNYYETFSHYSEMDIVEHLNLYDLIEEGLDMIKRVKFENYDEIMANIKRYKRAHEDWYKKPKHYNKILDFYDEIDETIDPPRKVVEMIFNVLNEEFRYYFKTCPNKNGMGRRVIDMLELELRYYTGAKIYNPLHHILTHHLHKINKKHLSKIKALENAILRK